MQIERAGQPWASLRNRLAVECINPNGISSLRLNGINPKRDSVVQKTCRENPSQSQRDCALQPRVARNELPWENVPKKSGPKPQRGCVTVHVARTSHSTPTSTLGPRLLRPSALPSPISALAILAS